MRGSTRRLPVAVAVLAAAVLTAAALGACGAAGIEDPTTNIDVAKDEAAKSQILIMRTAVAAYSAVNGVAPPMATREILGDFVDPWPKNPWTQAPMKVGKKAGDIVYAPGAGTDYTIGVVLSDGSVYDGP